MFRQILRTLSCESSSAKYLKKKYSDSNKSKTSKTGIAYEAEYFYKQDKELLEMLKQKLQDEVKCMQDEVTAMRNKIEDHNRTIDENMRFLKDLGKDVSASNKK